MRPSITTGAAVRTATALTAEVGAPEDATAAPSRMQASARVRANVGMGVAGTTVECLDRFRLRRVGTKKSSGPRTEARGRGR